MHAGQKLMQMLFSSMRSTGKWILDSAFTNRNSSFYCQSCFQRNDQVQRNRSHWLIHKVTAGTLQRKKI